MMNLTPLLLKRSKVLLLVRIHLSARLRHVWFAFVGTLLALGLVGAMAQNQNQSAVKSESNLTLVVLGSGGPGATGRAGSSYAVQIDGVTRILVDAGPGSFVRLGEAKLPLAQADVILLTHLHADHAGELPGLLKARAVSASGPIHFSIFGPDGHIGQHGDASFPSTRRFIDLLFGRQGAFSYLADFSAPITLKTTNVSNPTNLSQLQPQIIYTEKDLRITALVGHHRDAPAVVYRVDYAGKSITFSGDIDASGLPALRRLATGTDLLVFNSVVLDPPGSPAVLYTLHTPPQAIGELARDAHVSKLLLSHLSPSTERNMDAVKSSIAQNFQGGVQVAEDGLRVGL